MAYIDGLKVPGVEFWIRSNTTFVWVVILHKVPNQFLNGGPYKQPIIGVRVVFDE